MMALSYLKQHVQMVRFKMMNAWYYFYVVYDIKNSLFPSFPIPPSLFPSPSVSLFVLFTDLIDSYEKWLSVRVWAILLEREQLIQTTSTLNALTHTGKQESSTCVFCIQYWHEARRAHAHAAGKHTGLGTEIDKTTHECTHVHRCHALSISVRSQ